AQAVMFDINPPEKHARAMSIFGAGVVIGPILGPVLGGWLTESFNWRWVFLVNVPVGIVCTLMLIRSLPGTRTVSRRFDLFGFALLAVGLGALQMMLDRGQQQDWFQSWEIWIETGLALSAGWMFVVHMIAGETPIFEPRLFSDRNFVTSLLVMAAAGLLMMAGLALLPPMLQQLMGYSVLQSGFLTAPRGMGTFLSMTVAGRLMGKVDTRLLIMTGMVLMAVSLWQMSGFSLGMNAQPIAFSGFVQGLGMGLIFIPLNVTAFATIAPYLRTSAASLMTLMRSIGGSVGISMVTSLLARNLQTSHADLASRITPASTPPIDPGLLGMLGGAGTTVTMLLDAEINRQAAMIAYIDDFYLMMLVTFAALPLVLFMQKPRARRSPPPMVAE
ncbi:MAG: DHA2 family efflux MFS transporter permease subunit, partial [Sphingomonadales bacterium]